MLVDTAYSKPPSAQQLTRLRYFILATVASADDHARGRGAKNRNLSASEPPGFLAEGAHAPRQRRNEHTEHGGALARSLRLGFRKARQLSGRKGVFVSSSRRPPSPYAARQAAKRSALLAERAHGMRHSATASEALLWRRLRGSRLGVAFRRQVVLGRFIADFVAPQARLVVEVDGEYHARRGAADARRDAALHSPRLPHPPSAAELVERDVEAAVALVRQALADG